MTRDDAENFVRSFEAAWAARDGEAMRRLWHENGRLLTPLVNRPVRPAELPALVTAQLTMVPDLNWSLVEWAYSGDTVIVEWEVTQTLAGHAFKWCGVDRFLMQDGKILEERVYADTAPMRAMSDKANRRLAAAASAAGTSPTPMILL